MSLELRVCAADGCDGTFEPNRRGRPRLYCDECSTGAAYNRRWRKGETHAPPRVARPSPLARPVKCAACGERFVRTWGTQRYCADCGQRVTVQCDGCGRTFEARRRDRERGWGRWCGKACFRRQRIKEHPLPQPSKEALARQYDPGTGRFVAS